MPHYMVQFTYTPEAWATMRKNPQNRAEKVTSMVEGLGGRLLSFYYCLGKYDGVAIIEYPDDLTAAAGSVTSNAGHLKEIKTTRLFTPEEGIEVMRKSGGTNLQLP